MAAPSPLLEHACPQCGAPVALEDSSAIFQCPFCRVRLAITHHGPPALYLVPRFSPTVYLPYWRVRGIVLSADLPGVHGKFFDATIQGYEVPGTPASLGLRPQALPARFLEPHTPGSFWAPTQDAEPLRQAQTAGKGRLHASLSEATTLIFQPFALENGRLIDAISGDDLGPAPASIQGPSPEPFLPRLTFQPALCPQCAFELTGPSASHIQWCHHCTTVWEITNQEIVPCSAQFIPLAEGQPSIWLPFWRIGVRTEGFSLSTWADMVELTGQPWVIQPWMRSRAFGFRVPAFKIRPDLFVLLTQQASLAPLPGNPPPPLPKENAFPATLAPLEACRALGVLLVALSPARKRLLEHIQGGRIRPTHYSVEYLPFVRTPTEYLQPDLNFALPASALAWAEYL